VWAEVMHQVLSLHISWDNLFTVLVDEDCVSYPIMVKRNKHVNGGQQFPSLSVYRRRCPLLGGLQMPHRGKS